ncbi:hypothetical protein ACUXAV_003262 [Cupriavidus metallidurans]|jgi:hypothetical protein|nr:hypothetical protein AU374_03810 [Cupriavidus metallidurans]
MVFSVARTEGFWSPKAALANTFYNTLHPLPKHPLRPWPSMPPALQALPPNHQITHHRSHHAVINGNPPPGAASAIAATV